MGFIIVLISIIWLFITLISSLFTQNVQNTVALNEITDYIEKIDNFALQGFNETQQLVHFIEADRYYNFKEKPALLLEPKVITYNAKGEEIYTMTSKRANYFNNSEIKFKGKVKIDSKSGVSYKINAKELLASIKTNDLVSHKEVIYFDENARIVAQGVQLKTTEDKMQLEGKTTIHQDSGQKILTRDLFVDQSNERKHYYSNQPTIYLASGNKINAEGVDMKMKKGRVTLLGKVKILQKSGSKIDTKSLVVKQSEGNEIYSTKEKVHYQSKLLGINAKGMHYDTKQQKIRLTGGVAGRYE